MDPNLGAGPVFPGGYISGADLFALDVIGWDIDADDVLDFINGPSTAPSSFIVHDLPSTTPTLEWASGQGSSSSSVFVFQGTTIDSSTKIFDQRDITGTSFTLPAGLLQPGGTYSWFVTAVNDFGYKRGDAVTFTVGNSCDPDVNQDGNVGQDDIDYLLNVIAGGANPTGIDPDFNHDGNVGQDDVDALLNVVAGGPCP